MGRLLEQKRIRPAGNRADEVEEGGSTGSILAESTDNGYDDAPAAEYFRGAYAVLVRGRTVRRHLYFNLPAAERAVKRAHARGDLADLVLVRLVPVQGGDSW